MRAERLLILGVFLLLLAGCREDTAGTGFDDAGTPADADVDEPSLLEDVERAPDLSFRDDALAIDAGPAVLTITPHVVEAWQVFPGCGLESEKIVFAVTNNGASGAGPLAVKLTATEGAVAIVSDECLGTVLMPNESCGVTVRSVGGGGPIRALLLVTGSGADPLRVSITGFGVFIDPLAVTPVADFGEVVVGKDSSVFTITLSNTSCYVVTPIGVSLGGAHPREFLIVANGCVGQAVAANSTCTVDVIYRPTAATKAQAYLNFTALVGGSTSSMLSGTGIAP